jgi:hypothetical protein
LLTSGVAVFFQFALFLFVGVMLFAYYRVPSTAFGRADRIYPTFIVTRMPHGIAGLLIAAILAAAMSNLSAALNSLSSSSMMDFYLRFRPRSNEESGRLRLARLATVGWALVLFALAVLALHRVGRVVEVGLQIASVAYGALLGVFLLGVLTKRANQRGAMVGMICGFATELYLWQGSQVAFTWWVAIGPCGWVASIAYVCPQTRNCDLGYAACSGVGLARCDRCDGCMPSGAIQCQSNQCVNRENQISAIIQVRTVSDAPRLENNGAPKSSPSGWRIHADSSVKQQLPSPSPPRTARDLGPSHAGAVVVGTIIGSGIFLVPSEMMQAVGTARLVYLAWMVGGLLSFFGALTYAELGAMKPQAGGEYVYVRDAYGPLAGFLYSWTWFLIAKPASIATITTGLVRILGTFPSFPFSRNLLYTSLHIHLRATGRDHGHGADFVAELHRRPPRGRISVSVHPAEGCDHPRNCGRRLFLSRRHLGELRNRVRGAKGGVAGFFAALVAALWAYDGWNDLNMVAGEIRNPQRNIPLALIWGVATVGALYILVNAAVQYVLPAAAVAARSVRPRTPWRWCSGTRAPAWCRRAWRFPCS